ncbi:MAG TPA: hypothetical protein VF720_08910 [Candidatus Eisenbacteria bacterium]
MRLAAAGTPRGPKVPRRSRARNPRAATILLVLLALLGLSLVIGNAWVAEDAFITFRVVDNAVHGYGFRWNVDERVEVFTNPLWMLIHIPFHALWSNIFLLTIAISLVCTVLAVVIAARAIRGPHAFLAVTLLLPLLLSKTFVEFSTSGLENPMSHLLAALVFWLLLRHRDAGGRFPWFWLTCVIALSGVNRLDTLLLYLPLTAYLLVTRFREVPWGDVVAGTLPLVAWKLFALFYYGFPFPNTAYAKLATGASRLSYVEQGAWYLLDWLRRDPVSLLVLLAAIVLATGFLLRRRPRIPAPADAGLLASLAVGVLLYGLYVISVGGDFMAGRFWSLCLFVLVLAVAAALPRDLPIRRLAGIALLLLMTAGLSRWTSPVEAFREGRFVRTWRNIDDERLKYAEGHAFYEPRRQHPFQWSMSMETNRPDIIMWYAVGLNAYRCGSRTIVVDGLGLADPLLARMPPLPDRPFYVGHFLRGIPRDYMMARVLHSLDPLQPDLRNYYGKLKLIISGPLFDGERLATLVRFNMGEYDTMKEAYLASGEPYDALVKGDALYRGVAEVP